MRSTLVRLGSNEEHTGESRIMRSILVRLGDNEEHTIETGG